MSAASAFPVFDLRSFETAGGAERAALGTEVDRICRTTGFLAVTNHGIPQAVIDAAWIGARRFFDLPVEVKRRSMGPHKGYPYGYIGMEAEALGGSRDAESAPDLKESFNGGPLRTPKGLTDPAALGFCYAATPWPETPPGFKQAWTAYYAALEDLAARIMRIFAVALTLPEEYFAPFIDAPISALRALNYPEQHARPRPGQIRAGAHSDYGSLTILLPEPGSRGLEILNPNGLWTPVPPVAGAFIVNIGDLMAVWTNDRWVSTLHRVVNPPPELGGSDRRQSMAFFHQPNWDAEIAVLAPALAAGEAPRYAPVRSGPYLMGKFKSTSV